MSKKKIILIVVIVLFIAGFISAIFDGDESQETSQEAVESSSEQNVTNATKTPTKQNETKKKETKKKKETQPTTTERKLEIKLEFGVENEYSSEDECTNGDTVRDSITGRLVTSYIYKLPAGEYDVTYGYKYPNNRGIFYIEDDTISDEGGGYLVYDNIQYIWADYDKPVRIKIKKGQHIRLDYNDTLFNFEKIK